MPTEPTDPQGGSEERLEMVAMVALEMVRRVTGVGPTREAQAAGQLLPLLRIFAQQETPLLLARIAELERERDELLTEADALLAIEDLRASLGLPEDTPESIVGNAKTIIEGQRETIFTRCSCSPEERCAFHTAAAHQSNVSFAVEALQRVAKEMCVHCATQAPAFHLKGWYHPLKIHWDDCPASLLHSEIARLQAQQVSDEQTTPKTNTTTD